jgi:hypothetical protein
MISPSTKVASGLNNNYPLAWVVRVNLDSGNKYFSSIPLTISSISYVGGYILRGGFSDLEEGLDISNGGNIDYIGEMTLLLNQIVTDAGLHVQFAPFADIWTNRKVEVGIIYNDGTSLSTSDITWLYAGRVDSAEFDRESVSVRMMDYNEIEAVEIPHERINITDYPKAPTESIGKAIPLLYGDFYTKAAAAFNFGVDLDPTDYVVAAPAPEVDSEVNKYIAAGHVSHTIMSRLLYHDGNMTQFAPVESLISSGTYSAGTLDADDAGYTSGKIAPGQILIYYICQFSKPGGVNNATDSFNALDRDPANTVALDNATASDILGLLLDNVPAGEILTFSLLWKRSSGTESFRVGYANEGYVFTAGTGGTYVSTTAVTGGATIGPLAGANTSSLSKYMFIVNASGAGETVTITGFFARVDLFLTLNKNIPLAGRLIDPPSGYPRTRGGPTRGGI